jgi:SAM-dependent methyltransferase
MDDVSNLVARQYESYCYPEPFADIQARIDDGDWQYGDPSLFAALLWPEGRPREDLRILVAGCGTVQAAWFAYTNPRCQVTGIDLSEASLAHQRFLQERHGLRNLRLFQGDLRRVGEIGEAFDLVVSTGVLHHLRAPEEGLGALAAVLAPEGAMVLMLYGATRRVGVYLMQDVFRRLGLRQAPEDIGLIREVIEALPPYHYIHLYRQVAPDLAHDSGIVDTFLHPQDRAYTVPEVLDLLRRAGLAFQAWHDNLGYHPAGCIPRGSALRERVEALPVEEQWAIVENLTLLMGCHYFIACHPGRAARTAIDFGDEAWLDHVPVRHPFLTVLEEPVPPDRRGRARRGRLEWPFTADEAVLVGEADGVRRIREILAHPHFAPHAEADRTAFARRVYRRWWELGHLFMRRPGALAATQGTG